LCRLYDHADVFWVTEVVRVVEVTA
jgi:hypothetical protein